VPTLETRDDEGGRWITLLDGKRLALSAYRPDQQMRTPFTVYWRGRADWTQIVKFIQSLPLYPKLEVFDIVALTPNGEVQRTGPTTIEAIDAGVPTAATFARVECRPDDDRYGPGANFIVWTRLDLQSIPKGDPAPDEIGVYLTIDYLTVASKALSGFVVRTQNANISRDVVNECLSALSSYVVADHGETETA
jgi:hypothetical protein